MKYGKKYSIFIISSLLFFSCKKDMLMTFEAGNSLYFVLPASSTNTLDSIPIKMGYLPDSIEDTTINIFIALMGNILNKNVEFEIEVDPDSTTIQQSDYKFIGKYIFPIGKSLDTISINFKKPMDGAAMKLSLKFKPTTSLNNNIFEYSKDKKKSRTIRFFIDNILNIPKGWSTEPQGDYYVGVFSKKKLLLLSDLTIKATNDSKWTAELVAETFSYNNSAFGSFLNTYLNEMKQIGTPVLENDGSQMTAGPYYN